MIKSFDKWLLVSLLYKSCRRGLNRLAKEYFETLFSLDSKYCLYMLSVFLLEDIGVANYKLVFDFFNYIEECKAESYIISCEDILKFIDSICISPKDRSSNDMLSFSGYHLNETLSLYDKDLHDYFNLIEKSKFLVKDFSITPLVAGETEINVKNNLINVNKTIDTFLLPTFVYFLIILNQNKLENYSLGKYCVGDIFHNKLESYIDNDIIIDAVDCHTSQGRIAFTNFLESKNEFTDLINNKIGSKTIKFEILSKLHFLNYGGQSNNKFVYEPQILISQNQLQKISLQYFLDLNYLKDLNSVFINSHSSLLEFQLESLSK